MPGGDGTGPLGGGPGSGQGRGGQGGFGPGRGRMGGNRPGAGPVGDCICPQCGTKVAHTRGAPCNAMACPKCGARLIRS